MSAQPFRLDYKGMGEVLRGEIGLAAVLPHAEKVKAKAEAIAPDAPPIGEGYKYEFSIETGIKDDGTRAVATVLNSSEHAFYVEFGTKTTPRHRVLGRALGGE